MELTVKVHRIFENDSPVKAVCSVTLDEAYAAHGVKVIETQNGTFVGMPYETFKDQEGNDKRRDLFHPVTADARLELDKAVLAAYSAAKKLKAQAE